MDLSISVAMCTFNGKRFLSAQLDSIADQDRLPNELVICDDGSSDDCVDIVRKFARTARFPVHWIVNPAKLGSTKNFEKATSLCRGTIVAFADQDDVWYPHKLSTLEAVFRGPDRIVAAFSDADLIDEKSRLIGMRIWTAFRFNPRAQRRFTNGHALDVLIRKPVVTGATLAFRRESFELLAPIPAQQVHDRWISFLLAAKGAIALIAQPLLQYRRHPGQQIGLRPVMLKGRLAQAKVTGPAFYRQEILCYQQLSERLETKRKEFALSEIAVRKIKGKISHLEQRSQIQSGTVARLPHVIREMLNGGYWHYSSGWDSIAKDLLLRT